MNNWKLRHSFTGNATSDVQTVNGYLADPAYHLTTNLLLQSNQFDTTWTRGNSTVTGGQAGYDGTSDAWKVDLTNAGGSVRQTLSFSDVVTTSLYLKAGTLGFARLTLLASPNKFIDVNLSTGSITEYGGIISSNSEDVGGGWFRVSFTADVTNGSLFYVYPAIAINDFTATSGNIYIQDAQLEEGTQATTYVETTTEPVTLPDTFNVTVVPDGKEYAAPLFIPRTNLSPYSENLANIAWSKTRCTIDDNDTTGPEGILNGAKMTSTDPLESSIQDNLATTQTKVAWSFWAKKGDLDYVHGLLWDISSNGCRQWFNVSTGAVGGTTSFGSGYSVDSASIKDYGNGWYRCVMVVNCPVGTQGCRVSISDGNTLITSATNSYGYFYGLQLEDASVATEYIPTNGSAVTRDWSAFGRVQNQVPGICNGTHTHTGAASGSGIAATTITGSGSGATFAYDFDTLGVLTTLTADGAGSGYKVGDKLSIDTTEGHTIEFRLVEGSNAATVSVSMGAAKPNKPIPFPVSKMRVEGLTDRTVLFLDERSRYVFPKPTPYLLDTYEGAAAAYSLRRLRSSYTGPAVRVRRASNNDELDIYFNRDGSLDTATLEAFCAGTDGFVKVWFDQGQGGNDATQTSTASQPTIVSSGSVITENGKPAIELYGVTEHFVLTGFTNGVSNYGCFFVGLNESTGTFADYLFDTLDPTHGRFIIDARGVSSGVYYDGAFRGTGYTHTTQAVTSIHMVAPNSGSSYLNGTSTNTGLSYTQKAIGGPVVLGARYDGAAIHWDGKFQEFVLYNSNQSANRQGIEDNINEHYGIYEFSGLLDDYSGAAAAYSLRRLSSTYTGPAIRVVKHDVGYPEMDIPFEDDGTLSVVLLEAFADGYDATVKVWYDQSGGSNDAEQSTLASQPKIVNAGTVIYENGLPAAQFDGVNDYFTKAFTLGNPVSHFVVAKANNAGEFILDGYDAANLNSLFAFSASQVRLYNPSSGLFMSYTTGTQAVFSSISNGASSLLAVNGTSTTGTIGTSNMDGVSIGVVGTLNLAFCLDGTIQEVIIYNSDQDSNRTAIESNVNDFYSIYP